MMRATRNEWQDVEQQLHGFQQVAKSKQAACSTPIAVRRKTLHRHWDNEMLAEQQRLAPFALDPINNRTPQYDGKADLAATWAPKFEVSPLIRSTSCPPRPHKLDPLTLLAGGGRGPGRARQGGPSSAAPKRQARRNQEWSVSTQWPHSSSAAPQGFEATWPQLPHTHEKGKGSQRVQQDIPEAAEEDPNIPVLRRTDTGAFKPIDSWPVKDVMSGQVYDYDEVVDDMDQRIIEYKRDRKKELRTAFCNQKGMELMADKQALLDVQPLAMESGFDRGWLESLAREFHQVAKCRLDEVITLDCDKSHIDFSAFKRNWQDKRFFCHEGLLKRIFAICDDDPSHKGEIGFRQMVRGLKFLCYQEHDSAYSEAEDDSQQFLDHLTKLMDLEGNGTISKLSMYALCDNAIGKDDVYLLCDAVWEILTGGSRSMGVTEFQQKLAESAMMRKIFVRLMVVQCLRPGRNSFGARLSNREEVVREILGLTTEWRKKKMDGRFFFLDNLLVELRAAVESRDSELVNELIKKAATFQDSLRGQENAKAGHYVKVMFGVRESNSWGFALQEFDRVTELLGREGLSETQLQRFHHLLCVLESFKTTPQK